MKLLGLEVHNFCQHRHKEIEFHNRLNAFLGHNGSGKSNLLVSALGALTGDFSRTNGKKVENISQFAGEDEPSYVKLRFEHNGTTATVLRGLRGKQSYFQRDCSYSHTQKIRGDKAVTAAVADLLDVSTQMLTQYVFVAQGEIFAPLAAKPAERARSFQKLFGVSEAEKCWEALGTFLIQQRDRHRSAPDLQQITDDLVAAERTLATCVEELETTFKDFPSEYIDAEDPNRIRITSHNQWTRYNVEVEGILDKLQICAADLDEACDEYARARFDRDRYAMLVDESKQAYTDTKELLSVQEKLQAEHNNRQRLTRAIVAARQEEEDNPEPVPPEDWVALDELTSPAAIAHIDELKAEQRKCDHLLAYFADPDSKHHQSECPTCGTHVDDIAVDAEELRGRLRDVSHELDEHKRKLAEATEHHAAMLRWNAWRNVWKRNIDHYQAEYDALPESSGEPLDQDKIAEDTRFVEQHEAQMAMVLTTTAEYDRAAGNKGYIESTIGGWNHELELVLAKRDEHVQMSFEEVEEAEAACASRRTQHYAFIEAKSRKESAAQAVDSLDHRRVQALNVLDELARADEFYEHLEAVRQLLHRDNLPRIVAQNYLELLETDTNELLTLFDTDYRIRAVEGMGFEALFEDGRVQPAARLSGGQKVVLALAFRIAVNSMFANDLSLLCLDEPTAYLDDDNIGCLSVALDRLRDLSASRGLQCVLITHEDSLGHLFDQVVQL